MPSPPRLIGSFLQNSITLLIVLNTLVLALDHHPMDQEFSTYLEVFNFAFSLCFMLEMALKVGVITSRSLWYDRPCFQKQLYLVSTTCW